MSTAINKKLAIKIRSLRKKAGYTQEQLAGLSGIDYKHIQLLESKNPSDIKLSTLDKLRKAFKISLSELLRF